MINFEPNVAVIDDKFEEVKGIVNHYHNLGIGCKFFDAHLITGDTKPEKTYSDISLVFLDIYFSSNFADYNPEFCTGWIQSLLPPKSFYILIIWTTDTEKGEEVLTLLKQSNHNPFFHLIEGKKNFVSHGKYDFTKLIKKIDEKFKELPVLYELDIWKRNLKIACNKLIRGLTRDFSHDQFIEKLQRIIIGHAGTWIKSESEQLKREVLFEAFNQILNSNITDFASCPEINENNISGLYGSIPDNLGQNIDRELNSWFYFKLDNNSPEKTICSGQIAKMNHRFLRKVYSIKDDDKLNTKLNLQNSQNGVSIEEVVVVLTRACDFAQNKFGKNIKLMSGLLLINPYRHSSGKSKGKIHFNNSQNLPDSCLLFDHIYLSEEFSNVAIIFDFRYVFSLPKDIYLEKFSKIKVFNKELFSEIQVKYSSYSSRIGITQIY